MFFSTFGHFLMVNRHATRFQGEVKQVRVKFLELSAWNFRDCFGLLFIQKEMGFTEIKNNWNNIFYNLLKLLL